MELRVANKIFFEAKKSEGITAKTYQTYRNVIKQFSLYLMDEGIFDVCEVKPHNIRAFLVKHKEQGVRNITLHQDFRAC